MPLRWVVVAALLGTASVTSQVWASSRDGFAAAQVSRSMLSQSPDAEPAAQVFAATIDRHYNALSSLSVEFIQQYNGMGLDRTESGTLLLRKPGRLAAAGQMRWTYTKPAGKLFVLDGHNAYFYTPGQSEIARVPAKKLDDLRSPLAFLLGRASLAKQLEGLKIERGGMLPGPNTLMLIGIPRGMEKRVAQLTIAAEPNGTITMLRVEQTDGVINSFELKHEQPNAPAPANAFSFTPPAGTHVVDGMPPL